ncbi:hypothetical protein D3C81_1958760 [compost metagenome]
MYGLMMPPNCPIELISAMPAAAAMPARKRCGNTQKSPIAEMIPVAATVRPISSATVLSLYRPQMA